MSTYQRKRIRRYPITPLVIALMGAVISIYVSANSLADSDSKKPKVDISGFWALDEALSDDPKPILKEIGKSKKKKKRGSDSPKGSNKPIGSDTYRRYWEHVSDDKEWRTTANAAHGGSIKSLLFNKRLAVASTDNGFKVWYQDGFVRDINPNPYGRVFSASGDELVANGLGRTLSYVKKKRIISETRTKPRGEIIESFEPSADGKTLAVIVKVDRPDWEKIVELKQVYRRIANADVEEPNAPTLE